MPREILQYIRLFTVHSPGLFLSFVPLIFFFSGKFIYIYFLAFFVRFPLWCQISAGEMTATSTTSVGELEEDEKEQKIREIVVLPAPEIIDARQGTAGGRDANESLKEMAKAMREKTRECAQSRVVINDIGGQLAKLYDALEVKRAQEFEQRLDELARAGDERTGERIAEIRDAFGEWEALLAQLDNELERVAGPNIQTELGATGREIQLVSSNKMFKGGSLLSYVQSSSYPLMFLEVVASFAVQECYEHVKRMFDSLAEFHKLGCDILLLARRPAAGGSGFLKLIGMPFRQMLNDSESMRQILQHRQSAISMAGIRALHIYTEFLCNDYTLELANNNNNNNCNNNNKNASADAVEETATGKKVIGEHSGCVLINRHGHILYSYLCTDSSDWPDVEVLLEQVRVNCNRRSSVSQRSENALRDDLPTTGAVLAGNSAQKANGTAEVTPMAPPSTEGGEVAVHKRKCCCVM